jgi:hypothetical protein
MNVRGESFVATLNALCAAKCDRQAVALKFVMDDKREWEVYARQTFLAHLRHCPANKLRFLQYVTKDTQEWWSEFSGKGAVLL